MADTLKLALEISAKGGAKTADEIARISEELRKTAQSSEGITKVAQALGITYKEAKNLSSSIGLSADKTEAAVQALRQLSAVGADAATKQAVLAGKFDLTGKQIEQLEQAVSKYKTTVSNSQQQTDAFGGGVAGLAFKFNNVISAVQSLAAAAKPAYDFLIGSNEKLNAQLLSSQTNLASATKISVGGAEITDPTEKINATRPALKAALKQIEQDTQSLVGVTSSQVNDLFQITLTNAAELNNQSKQFPDPIAAATSLTKGWAASLKVVGIPLDQARQEINSIIKGQVDQNSILAKNLGITNEQVNKWKSQGTLVDELNKRLNVFVAGNAIAARSIDGIGSNIADLLERVGREAGAGLLEPVINALAGIEGFLKSNEAAITAFFQAIASTGVSAANSLGESLGPAFKEIVAAAGNSGPAIIAAFEAIAATVTGLVAALSPVLTIVGQLINQLAQLASSDLGQIGVQAGVITIAITALAPVMAGLAVQFGALAVSLGGSLIASLTALPALFAAASTAALPLAAALAPLAGAIALTFVVKGTQDMANAQEQIDSLGVLTDGLSEKVLSYAQKLKSLNDIEKNGGTLNAEQIEQRKRLLAASGQVTKGVDEQIAALKGIQPANEEQKNAIAAQIAGLEKLKGTLDKSAGGLKIQGKELETLGSSYDQLKKKAENAQQQVNSEGGGDSARFQKSAEELIKLTEQQVNLGQITQAEAEKRLSALASNTKLEVDTQQKAQDAIAKIRSKNINDTAKTDTDKAKLAEAQSQAEIAGLVQQGVITKEEGEQRKIESVQKRIAAELAAEQTRLSALEGQGKQANPEAEKQRQDAIRQSQEKIAQLQLQGIQQREAAEKAALDRVKAANEKAVQEIAASQNQRIIAVKQAQVAGTIGEEEAAKRIAEIQAQSVNEEVAAKQKAIAAVQAARANGSISAKQANEEEKKLTTDLAQLNLKRLDAELAAVQRLKQAKLKAIDEELAKSRSALDQRAGQLTLSNQALGQESNLLNARVGLQGAINNLQQQGLKYRLEDAKAAGNFTAAGQIQAQLYKSQQDALKQQYQAKLQTLALTEKQKANELELLRINAEIAQLEAQSAVEKAKAEGKSQAEIDRLQKIADLRGKQVAAVDTAKANQGELNTIARQQAGVENKTQQQTLDRDQQQGNKQLNEEAKKAAEEAQKATTNAANSTGGLAGSADKAADSLNKLGNAVPTPTNIPARRMGGDTPSGFVQGAEVGPELIRYDDGSFGLMSAPGIYTFPQPGHVFTATQTAAMMGNLTPIGVGSIAPSPPVQAALNSDLIDRFESLEKAIIRLANTPRSLSVSTPAPMETASEIAAELSRQRLRSAGL